MKIHNRILIFFAALAGFFLYISCQKKEVLQPVEPEPVDTTTKKVCPGCNFPDTLWTNTSASPKLIFRLNFDSLFPRLNDQGQIVMVPAGNGAQSPLITGMSINYIELMPAANTEPGKGLLLYKTAETDCGGPIATNFCKGVVVGDNEIIFSKELSKIAAGAYPWLRISIAYCEMEVRARSTSAGNGPAQLAGFSGDRTYFAKTQVGNSVLTPTTGGTGNKDRGYWIFRQPVFNEERLLEGYAPHTTVVNTNSLQSNTSTQAFVYGEFYSTGLSAYAPLQILGTESQDIEVQLLISTNKSFEWKEVTADGLFQPEIGETIVDFGCRGLTPMY